MGCCCGIDGRHGSRASFGSKSVHFGKIGNISHRGDFFLFIPHLKQLWIGIWQHTHTITTTDVYPDLGEFTEILDDVSAEMIPVRYH